jgi:hypothetical protein
MMTMTLLMIPHKRRVAVTRKLTLGVLNLTKWKRTTAARIIMTPAVLTKS